jgi:hypothetical protein
MKTLSLVVLASLATVSLASTAAAQERLDLTAYRTEMSATTSILRDVGETAMAGFQADFGKQVWMLGSAQLSAVGEVAVHHFNGRFNKIYTQGAGGVRIGAALSSKLRPYGQIMFGFQREFNSTGSVIQAGGGLNWRAMKKLDAKVQVDFPVLSWRHRTYNQFRFSAGVGIPLGR